MNRKRYVLKCSYGDLDRILSGKTWANCDLVGLTSIMDTSIDRNHPSVGFVVVLEERMLDTEPSEFMKIHDVSISRKGAANIDTMHISFFDNSYLLIINSGDEKISISFDTKLKAVEAKNGIEEFAKGYIKLKEKKNDTK